MKIIIVDDEPLVKQYIVQCVRDAGGENEITAAVTSGAKVLREMKENPADVVFADITMPKMDGIELLQELRQQYPGTAVIMLTCHDDFEYARAAMQNGAKDYILKTEVSADKIRAVLDKLQSSRQQRISKNVVQQIGRSRFLRRMAEQNEDMLPVSAADLQENSIYLSERAFLTAVFSNQGQNVEKMQRNVQERFDNPLFYAYSEQEVYLLVNLKRDTFAAEQDAAAYLIGCEAQLSGGIGCSGVHHHFANLPKAFAEAARDFDARFYQVPAQELPQEIHVSEVESCIMRATVKLTDGDIQGGCADLERLLQCAEEYKVRSSFVRETVQQLFSGFAVKLEPDLQHTADAVASCRTFEALCEAVREGIAVLQRKHGAGYSAAISKALDHINAHYAEDLSLNTVADVVFLNRDYLSRQFKKEVGVNFSEYLMSVRMKHARRLLENSSLRISEVALSVGITNMSYFSTVFHKVFGCKPNDVRKNKQGG